NLFSGKENVALGFAAGANWTGGDNNVSIVNVGVAGESNTMRLGESGFQNRTFIAGIRGVTPGVAGALPVGIDSNGQLGTTFTIPGSYISGSIPGSVISGPIATTGSVSVATGTQPKSTMLPAAIGANLAAATSTDRPITIQADTSAGGSEWISFKNSTGATKWHVNHKNAGVNFAETGVADGRLFLAPGGNVGIGTDAPTKATLEVTGSVATSLPANWNLSTSGLTQVNMSGFFGGISIYASHLIAAQALVAYSDQRMKRITGRSNAARDLATLSAIEITDYTHIDTANRGDKPHKKVIAQQVEKIYPQAVNQIVDVVPDIYQPAPVKDGWIMLATNLKKGDRVRLIGKAAKGEHEVLEVAEGRFRTAFKASKADGDTVFVYGREVKDFRTVDYEAISMLNVSATQELHRRAETQSAEIAALRQELQEIRALLGASKTAAPKKP
ncbi:MAG: tail fiber domain-containing protein, partial [Betaproteobacteria bacterium]|nr:tail fiber domain-containing protein [Betaproteobacteria bacterium]